MALRSDPEKQRDWERRSRKPLKRTAMKRSAPKQRGRNDRGEAHDIIKQAEIDARRRFQAAAKSQRVCARCGKADSFDPHHVVEQKWLKANGFSVIEQYDPDNSLRVCDRFTENNCHGKHTARVKYKHRLHLQNLRQENLEFAFRVMGAAAGDYLRRRYRGDDPRLEALEAAHGG